MPLVHGQPDRAHGHTNPLVTGTEAVPGMEARPPKRALNQGPVSPRAAYQLIKDELLLDGSARLNLATFVTTWMEPQALRLMSECADKNMIDKDEYPQTAEIERRCVAILADLWHAPAPDDATGCSTTGSSEACMLAGHGAQAALGARVRDAGGDLNVRKPNLVMGANVQVCWEKFCRYWDVEPRTVPMEGERFHLEPAGRDRRLRREHHRRGRDPRLHLRRQLRAGRGDRRRAGQAGWPAAARTSRCTWTAPPAG